MSTSYLEAQHRTPEAEPLPSALEAGIPEKRSSGKPLPRAQPAQALPRVPPPHLQPPFSLIYTAAIIRPVTWLHGEKYLGVSPTYRLSPWSHCPNYDPQPIFYALFPTSAPKPWPSSWTQECKDGASRAQATRLPEQRKRKALFLFSYSGCPCIDSPVPDTRQSSQRTADACTCPRLSHCVPEGLAEERTEMVSQRHKDSGCVAVFSLETLDFVFHRSSFLLAFVSRK